MTKTLQTIADLTPDEHNANRGTVRGRAMIEASIRECGAGRSIVVDREGRVIGGNKTLDVIEELGIPVQIVPTDGKTLVVVQRTDLDLESDPRARRLAYLDNRTTDVDLEWDAEAIAADLEAGVGLGDLFDKSELDEILADLEPEPGEAPDAQIDKADELQQKWGTARGQLWEIGKHRLLCGDSTVPQDVERLLAGATPELMVTDPPYGVEYKPEWRNEATGSSTQRLGKVANDDRASWAMAFRLFPGPVAYVWHAALYGGAVERALATCSFDLKSQIIWVKRRFPLSRCHYHWRHEACFYAVRQGQSAVWRGSRKQQTVWADIVDTWNRAGEVMFAGAVDEDTILVFGADQTTVWDIGSSEPDQMQTVHSTQKPVECMSRPMRNHTGDVYDPFLGSGSTMVAAEQLGRRCWGVELEPKYAAVILERMSGMGLEPRLAGESAKG